MSKSANKKISLDKARKPRSHESMVVFTLGARKTQELPFIMGVMADLAGKSKQESVPLSQRKFLEVDTGNFDARMAGIKPRVEFRVPNVMGTEGGELPVDLEFQSMDDFRPDVLARNSKLLKPVLEQREALENLKKYIDGKEDAEKLLEDLLKKIDAMSK